MIFGVERGIRIRSTLRIGRQRRSLVSSVRYFGSIRVIFDPCRPRPAINPFWEKMKA